MAGARTSSLVRAAVPPRVPLCGAASSSLAQSREHARRYRATWRTAQARRSACGSAATTVVLLRVGVVEQRSSADLRPGPGHAPTSAAAGHPSDQLPSAGPGRRLVDAAAEDCCWLDTGPSTGSPAVPRRTVPPPTTVARRAGVKPLPPVMPPSAPPKARQPAHGVPSGTASRPVPGRAAPSAEPSPAAGAPLG